MTFLSLVKKMATLGTENQTVSLILHKMPYDTFLHAYILGGYYI